mgnify:FL=1|jgi:hypothetical protein
MTKRRLKIRPVLIALNVSLLIIIALFYTFRLVKYYLKENGHKDADTTTLLVDELIKKQSYVDQTKGLVHDKNASIYRYIGKVEDNYLEYSGILFRIVGIDKDNNIKAISDSNLTLMYSGLEKGFDKSYVYKWLNKSDEKYSGIFENNMGSTDKYLTNTYLCDDVVSDLKDINCEKNNNALKITLLSLYDYASAGGKESYLNNGESYYLSTIDDKNNNYFINTTGDVGLNKISSKIYGVRPVITIKNDVALMHGDGSKTSPYAVIEKSISKLSDVYISKYINYSGSTYRVISTGENVKIALSDNIKDGDKYLEKTFGGKNNIYSTTKKTIGEYLNNTYYKSIKNNDLIVKSSYGIGSNTLDNLDYTAVYSKTNTFNIGMLTLGDMFISDTKNVLTMNRGIESSMIINVINKDGNVFGDLIASKYEVRPTMYLKGDINIVSGDGSIDSPYELGVNNEEKAKEE